MIPVAEPTALEIASELPGNVAVGADVFLNVSVQRETGGDLQGGYVEIVSLPDLTRLATASLVVPTSSGSETDVFAVRAPLTIGRHEWLVRFPRQEINGRVFADSHRQLVFETHALKTSLAVWGVPSPVLIGATFRIRIGAKSAGGYALKGAKIEVIDPDSVRLARGLLNDQIWPGTTSLHWTELELAAPRSEGTFDWSVTCDASDMAIPHERASATFNVVAVRPPNTRLLVRVSEIETGSPIVGAKLRLGVHRGASDEAGNSVLEVPDGFYTLTVWKSGYEADRQHLNLTQNQELEVRLSALPQPEQVWL